MRTKILELDPQYPDLNAIADCAKAVNEGKIIIFPTETVYGIGADADNFKAVNQLREIKGRADQKPLAVLVPYIESVDCYTSERRSLYKILVKYWPGPLTVVVPKLNSRESIGLRMPDHQVPLMLMRKAGCHLANSSANKEGHPAPPTCQEALRDLEGLVDIAIDSGVTKTGISSTVLDFSSEEPKILREGPISLNDIRKTMNKKKVLFVCTGNSCRSVMAEYLLNAALKNRDDVEVSSAGTGVYLRIPASETTLQVLREEGIDASRHMSQPIDNLMLKCTDFILVMTNSHREQIISKMPQVENRVYLLREFAGSSGALDISDPIGGSYQTYKECISVIKEAIHKIVQLI